MLNSSTIIVLLSTSPWVFVNICFMYSGAPAGCIYIYNCYIFFQDRFLDHHAINVFLLVQSLFYSWFGLIWVWQPQISFPFAWNIFFHPLTFSLHVSLDLRWISYKTAYMWFLFLYPFSHLIFFIGAFSPFPFKVIIDRYVPSAILLIVLGLLL